MLMAFRGSRLRPLVQPKGDAVEEEHPLDPFEALAAEMADRFPDLENQVVENWGSGIDFGEEEHTPLDLFTELAALELFPPALENEWEQREVGCGFRLW